MSAVGAGWEPQEDADAFQAHLAEQAEKKAKAKAAKDAKIARDAKVRADKAQAQAQGERGTQVPLFPYPTYKVPY